MDVRITWAVPPDILITDEFDVFYREADPANINNWIKANPAPLPSTTSFYDITGLKPGTVYRFGVSKSCLGTGSFVDQISYTAIACPIISVYQGPPVIVGQRFNPTLFYSLYYPDSTHVYGSYQNLLDFTDGNAYANCNPALGLIMAAPVGRTTYQTVDICTVGPPAFLSCNTDSLDFNPLNSSLTSALGYYGLGNTALSAINFYTPICDTYGTSTDPILLKDGNEFRFAIRSRVLDPVAVGLPPELSLTNVSNLVGSCGDITGASLASFTPTTIPILPTSVSGALCYDPVTGGVDLSLRDGTNQMYLPSLSFSYTTYDSLGNPLPLVNSSSVPIQSSEVQYNVYVPILFTLDPVFYSSGMGVSIILNDPTPNIIHTITNADYTGLTQQQLLNAIATDLAVNTSYTADVVTVGGSWYLRIYVNGTAVVSGELIFTGPALYGYSNLDLTQTALANNSFYGIQSAFIYNVNGADYIYGARTSTSNPNQGEINVTRIDPLAPSSVDYTHTIDFINNQIILVDEPVPAVAYDVNHIDRSYGSINLAVRDDVIAWNDGYRYVATYSDINVYDTTDTLIDTYTVAAPEPIRLLEFNQTTGHLYVLCENLTTNNPAFYVLDHTGIGAWGLINSGTYPSSNRGYEGTITGYEDYYTISAAGADQWSWKLTVTNTGNLPGWTGTTNLGFFSDWRVQVINCAADPTKNGKVLRLQAYCPNPLTCNPVLNTPSNNAVDTVYLNPNDTVVNTGWTTILQPGDTVALMYAFTDANGFFDWNATYPQSYTGWNIILESGTAAGGYAKGGTVNIREVRLSGYNGAFGNYITNRSYGVSYRIQKTNDGALKWNPVNGFMYHSCGSGNVQLWKSTGAYDAVYTLKTSTGASADGSFQMNFDPNTGDMYAIMRDFTVNQPNSDPGNSATLITSQEVFILDSSFTVQNAINGSTKWGENIGGNLVCVDSGGETVLYMTSLQSRNLIQYNINTDTTVKKQIPSVYSRINDPSLELVCGITQYSGSEFVIMNRLKANTTATLWRGYDYSNLFVYDFSTNTIVQALVGGESKSYSGSGGSWNTANYGQIFGENNYFKDYGAGGISVRVVKSSIFWKDYMFRSSYYSTSTIETGVAQLWSLTQNQNGGRLLRIYNIQSDSSLVASKRSLIFTGDWLNETSGAGAIAYSSFYKGVIIHVNLGSFIGIINPATLAGYYGGYSFYIYPTTQYRLGLSSFYPTNYLYNVNAMTGSVKITVDDNGYVYLLGNKNASNQCTYQIYSSTELTGSNVYSPPLLGGYTGDGANPGVYETGVYAASGGGANAFPHIYVSSTDEIWTVGTLIPSTYTVGPPAVLAVGDQIIAAFDKNTMTVTQTYNLTQLDTILPWVYGTPSYIPPYYFWNHVYVPGADKLVFYSGTWSNNRFIIIDPTTKDIIFNGTINLPMNLKRPLPLSNQNIGTIVPYGTGIFIDINTPASTVEKWTYLDLVNVDYSALTHNFLTVTVNGTDILVQDDVYATTLTGGTFGQWKVTTTAPLPGNDVVYWNNITGGGTITINPNETIELTQFSMETPLIKVENLTTATVYDITDPTYLNVNTLPTFNTLNSIPFFAIKADNINISNGDQIQLTFENPSNPTCPFVTNFTINF